MAPPTSGPRQTIGWPSGTKNWIEIVLTPYRSSGVILLFGAGLRLALDAHHQGDVRAGDVAVEETDRRTGLGQGDGEIDAHRALADAALARRDRDDVLHAGNELLRLARLRPADHRAPVDLDAGRADVRKRGPRVALDLVLERAGRGRELDLERDGGTVDGDVLDHVERDEVPPELGLLDRAHRSDDVVVSKAGHRGSVPFGSWGAPRVSDGGSVDIVPRRSRGRDDRSLPSPVATGAAERPLVSCGP